MSTTMTGPTNPAPVTIARPTSPFPLCLARLPSIPDSLDPDRWLRHYHNRFFKRRISSNGSVQIDKHHYYIQRRLAARYVVCKLDTHRRVFDVMVNNRLGKSIPIKGLYDEQFEFADYLALTLKEAEAERRRLQCKQSRRVA